MIDFSEKINNGKYESSKEFEIAFIPKKSDSLFTPKIEINYFDINDRKYKTFVVQPKEIKAIGSQNTTVQSNNTLDNKSKNNNVIEDETITKEKNIIKSLLFQKKKKIEII